MITAGIMAFSASLVLTGLLVRFAPTRLLDYPNERSLHHRPVPRGGGLGILGGLALSILWLIGYSPGIWHHPLAVVVAFALAIGLFSFIDDWRSLSPLARFLVQGLLSGLLLGMTKMWPRALPLPGPHIDWPTWVGVTFAWLWTMWMLNLYNFMDGMDGFAAGMAVWGFGTLGVLSWLSNDHILALFSTSVALAALGFLVWNFPPARIFMGDIGSTALGFLAATFILYADTSHRFSLWIGASAFAPFIADATITLLRRAIQREKIWQPHRAHYYQRLVRAGWGHRRTVLVSYLLMGITSGWSVFLFLQAPRYQKLGFWSLVCGYVGLALWLEYQFSKQNSASTASE